MKGGWNTYPLLPTQAPRRQCHELLGRGRVDGQGGVEVRLRAVLLGVWIGGWVVRGHLRKYYRRTYSTKTPIPPPPPHPPAYHPFLSATA